MKFICTTRSTNCAILFIRKKGCIFSLKINNTNNKSITSSKQAEKYTRIRNYHLSQPNISSYFNKRLTFRFVKVIMLIKTTKIILIHKYLGKKIMSLLRSA